MSITKPLVICIEGMDGCGKTTLIENLVEKMNAAGLPTTSVSQIPKGYLREAILNDHTLTPVERATLVRFAATEAARQVDERLSSGFNVLVDRGPLTYQVYQGIVDGVSGYFKTIEKLTGQPLVPDWTILLDLDETIAEERMIARGVPKDVIEARGVDYQRMVRQGFLALQAKDMDRIVLVDADQSPKLLASEAYDAILDFFAIEAENSTGLV